MAIVLRTKLSWSTLMIDKAQQLAQSAADSLSRRSFLGSIGRAAAGAALVCGGLLAQPKLVHAGRQFCDDYNPCRKGKVCFEGRCVREKR
jgi:hypothetical protein